MKKKLGIFSLFLFVDMLINARLRELKYAKRASERASERVGVGAPVYLAAVMKYLLGWRLSCY